MTSPRAEATAATRAGLVEAATELFAARGFTETSIDDVAAVAGMTKGAVYHHFAGKAALFEAVFSAQETAVHERLGAALDGAPDQLTGARAALTDVPGGLHRAGVRADRLPRRPAGAGWQRWQECERDYAYAFIARVLDGLAREGHLARAPGVVATRRSCSGCSPAPASCSARRRPSSTRRCARSCSASSTRCWPG